ncbi:MAG TPA: cutinase family protein, partial [Candidatus Saccharimonas sp.]|nr:cutinase family protein [Candidatus Saccharimonas sp.]
MLQNYAPGAWAELGNLDNVLTWDYKVDKPSEYPAYGWADWGIFDALSGYYHSVQVGANELYAHLKDRVSRCPRESIVLGGYSQGAQVIDQALSWLDAGTLNHIGFVAEYGDPIALRGCASPWQRGSASCQSGILGSSVRYIPISLNDRAGSWCDSGDGICTGNSYSLPGNHTSAYDERWVADSSWEIVHKALAKLNQLNGSSVPLPSYTITPPNPPGPSSPPPPPPALTGASPIQNGGFNQDTSHWSVSGSANLVFNNASSTPNTYPYEGAGFAAINASQPNDSVWETNVATISLYDTYCVSARVNTIGQGSGGGGTLALWLLGSSNDVSTTSFSNLPGPNAWQEVKTCVMATGARQQVKVQFYPTPGAPTMGIDAVDVHQTLNVTGGFNNGNNYWNLMPGTNLATYTTADNVGTTPYEGSAFGATNTSRQGGSFLQDMPHNIGSGDTFCVEAQVVTVGNVTGASGALALYLMGGDGATEQSAVQFGPLPGGNAWTAIKTCVTATTAHNMIRVQLYPAVNGPTLGVDNLDVHGSIALNGGFNTDVSHWSANGSLGYMEYGNFNGTTPYEGTGFEIVQTNVANSSLSQVRRYAWAPGDTFCAEASVVTGGTTPGGGGVLALWLLRPDGSKDVSNYVFSALPAGNAWMRIKTCVMAS